MFKLFFTWPGGKFLELNLNSTQKVMLNASSRYFQGFAAVLSIVIRQSSVWSRTTNPLNNTKSLQPW